VRKSLPTRPALIFLVIALLGAFGSVAASTSSAAAGQSYVRLSTFQLDFGDCVVGSTCGYPQVTYTNITNRTLAVDAPTFARPSFFQLTLDGSCIGFTSGVGLAPGGSCTEFLSFHPEEAKTYTNQICFNFPDEHPSKVCVRLTGRGVL
jgi:hypothetical protein